MNDIRYRVMPDDEYARVLKREPNMGKGYDEWCPTCDKKGVYTAVGGAETECDCQMQVALFKWYSASGVGQTYMRLGWLDYHGPEGVLVGVNKYIEKFDDFNRNGMGLYLSGGFGVGKTMLTNLVLKHLIKRGISCFATTFANTIEMFTAGWGDRVEKEWFQRKFLQSQVLLLDDLGKELRNTKVALAETTFDSILRQRVTDGRPTMVTTNLTPADLGQGYGNAILSLIREQSLEEVVSGSDFRPKANDRKVDEVLKGWVRPIV